MCLTDGFEQFKSFFEKHQNKLHLRKRKPTKTLVCKESIILSKWMDPFVTEIPQKTSAVSANSVKNHRTNRKRLKYVYSAISFGCCTKRWPDKKPTFLNPKRRKVTIMASHTARMTRSLMGIIITWWVFQTKWWCRGQEICKEALIFRK